LFAFRRAQPYEVLQKRVLKVNPEKKNGKGESLIVHSRHRGKGGRAEQGTPTDYTHNKKRGSNARFGSHVRVKKGGYQMKTRRNVVPGTMRTGQKYPLRVRQAIKGKGSNFNLPTGKGLIGKQRGGEKSGLEVLLPVAF